MGLKGSGWKSRFQGLEVESGGRKTVWGSRSMTTLHLSDRSLSERNISGRKEDTRRRPGALNIYRGLEEQEEE